jgi:enoyl-[acyl-carrier-protein] reductase (NADH)
MTRQFMTIQTVGILSPGDMGQAIAAVLQSHSLRVVATLDDRCDRTRALASEAGIQNVGSLERLVFESDTIIRINAISPGLTATDRAEQLAEQNARSLGLSVKPYKADALRSFPLGRIVPPEEIAHRALFLVSDLAAFITGAEVLVDGGSTPGV